MVGTLMDHLFWINFTHKCNGLEILKAQVRELKKFRRHERHDDVESKQADVSSCDVFPCVSTRLGRREINEVLMRKYLGCRRSKLTVYPTLDSKFVRSSMRRRRSLYCSSSASLSTVLLPTCC